MNVQKFFILNDPFPIEQHRLLLATSSSGTELPVRLGLALCHRCVRSNLS